MRDSLSVYNVPFVSLPKNFNKADYVILPVPVTALRVWIGLFLSLSMDRSCECEHKQCDEECPDKAFN